MLDIQLNEVKLFGFYYFPNSPFHKQKNLICLISLLIYSKPDRSILKKSRGQPVVYFVLNVTSVDF